ncbi:DNA-binding SARP family transcriptional activator [Kitasatospora sp. MAA4]|uniref:AfsR/SARP family transcriptional regulator n=1 Tax=Kitasatospora sp. MAA4 TaxID=3035093 RepID=UPI0024744CBF|nr:BTAD domain-containing putative transcriptional regulator [Kitasatospora sp. MAA4]MDH6133287.1 DNA-binding SARP family transcriptional activator [Kitasatospora sp. MAA4]
MGIRLLGPVELRLPDGSPAEVAGAKRRAVLALLALELGRSVPVERFFEMLWGEDPPAQARAALQGHVAALRKVLDGTPFTLQTRAPGYLLCGEAELVDARRFEELVARAEGLADRAEAAELCDRALALWSGAALADLPDTELRRALAERLDETRTRALTVWAQCLLGLGQGVAAIAALEQQVRSDGLREQTVALLVRCLHQAGRSSAALNAYHLARRRLDEELGVAPGPALQAALAAVLAEPPTADSAVRAGRAGVGPGARAGSGERVGGPLRLVPVQASSPVAVAVAPAAVAVAVAPAADRGGSPGGRPAVQSLPRQPLGFVGRAAESQWLDGECGADRVGNGLAVLIGPAGVGKTATALRWAHAASPGFPDGQLFVDLRGFDPAGPAGPDEVLTGFLRALGLPEDSIPADPAARAALYREETARRRLLVVLDNAHSAAEISELLPAGPGCATVVTSRGTLEDLVVTEGAAMLRMETLSEDEALHLLERMLTPQRVRAEREAAVELVALCDRLPLALRIAAAKLAARPAWSLADLVAELRDERTRLTALDTRGGAGVRTGLFLTYCQLPIEAARLLPLLAVHPGVEVDTWSAAALLDTDQQAARQALGALASYHLLVESSPGRYRRPDLIRLYSQELSAKRGAAAQQAAAGRLLKHYLATAHRSATALQAAGQFLEYLELPEYPSDRLPRLDDPRAALDWLHAEQSAIRALPTATAAAGTAADHPEQAARLAELCAALSEIQPPG